MGEKYKFEYSIVCFRTPHQQLSFSIIAPMTPECKSDQENGNFMYDVINSQRDTMHQHPHRPPSTMTKIRIKRKKVETTNKKLPTG